MLTFVSANAINIIRFGGGIFLQECAYCDEQAKDRRCEADKKDYGVAELISKQPGDGRCSAVGDILKDGKASDSGAALFGLYFSDNFRPHSRIY